MWIIWSSLIILGFVATQIGVIIYFKNMPWYVVASPCIVAGILVLSIVVWFWYAMSAFNGG